MRTPADMPSRRLPGTTRRSRVIAIVVVLAIIVLLFSLSGLARFWTDYLWFQSVGFTSVFRGVLLTKVLLALVFIVLFFVIMFGNLVIADRVAPDDLDAGADELVLRYRDVVQPRGRLVRIVVSVIFAVLGGIGADREWNNWDLLRYHVSFGVNDPLYHKDIGFYVFELPFIKFLLGWAFEAVIVVFIVTAVAHYLNGGIHVQDSPRRVTGAVKTHLSVLLGVLALIKGVDYYFQRLELVLSRSYVVNGATATSVHAEQPAKFLLIIIAVIAAGLFLYNIREKGWTLPAVAVGLWALVYIVIGVAYPAIYQAAVVKPSEATKEATFIQRNINATRSAYGLDKVQVDNQYQYSPTVTTSEIQGNSLQAQANRQTIANVRLLDPAVSLSNTFDKYQAIRPYYEFDTLGLDRYVFPSSGGTATGSSAASSTGSETATISSVRELNTNVPSGFVNQHLEYTHGYGAVTAPISQAGINPDGSPNFTLANLPPKGTPTLSDLGSQIYYGLGKDTGGYVIAGSKTSELDYQSASGAEVTTKYSGKGGVDAGSIVRRAAFALRFSDLNFLLSGQITPSSKVMYIRNVVDRVKKAAPFLKYDSDPYPVVLNGSVYWVIDAYTTTDNYPYSQNANTSALPAGSGLQTSFNYARNSVKVVVSAYDGSMNFFVVDPTDPVIQVYEKAFPDLFKPVSEANTLFPGITAHFRYPEDLFQVQTTMYGRYHLTNAGAFYTQAQAWTVSPDPGSGPLPQNSALFAPITGTPGSATTTPAVTPLAPQYVLAHLPGSTQQNFLLVTSFVPVGGTSQGQNLTGLMTASSDYGSANNPYGTLKVFQTPFGQTVDGPLLVSSAIRANPAISAQLTLLDQHGSQVELGEVAIVPIDQTLLYVQPVYVESTTNSGPPLLKDVVVVYNGKAYQSFTSATSPGGASLDAALCQISNSDGTRPFSSYCNTPQALGQSVSPGPPIIPASGPTSPSTTTPSTTVPSSKPSPTVTNPTVANLLAKAATAYSNAQNALKAGNLAQYQADITQAQSYVSQAQVLVKG